MDAWRGFDLTIEAMAKAIKENAHIHLTIVGDGSDRKGLKNLLKDLSRKSCNIDWESFNGNLQKNDG